MKSVVYIIFFLHLLVACKGVQITEKLNHVDSLVIKEQYDSACVIMKDLNNVIMSAEEQAHYYLLATQLGYLTKQPLSSDSLLDLSIKYYIKVENSQKLADAYYYKSCRYRINGDYLKAIEYSKKAEQQANNTNDINLKFKIVENLSFLNGLCENDQLQLQYAKRALKYARRLQKKNWMAYSYNKISFAFANLGQYDSAYYYIEQSIPYIKYVKDADKKAFLTNCGLLYKDNDNEKAKAFFEKALTYGEMPDILEHLADVYYAEGNKDKAYKLWKKALTKDSRYKKDNLIYSILSYDIERGKLDEASKNLDEVIAIKDSMLFKLRNDTVKDLQLRFDHEVAMHEADKKLINTQWMLICLVVVVGVMALYIYIRRKKEETLQKEHQMQLYAYTVEINRLKSIKDNAIVRINELENQKEKDSKKIRELEDNAQNADLAIEQLNKNIKKLLDDESPKLKTGRMLYDHIMEGGTTCKWTSKEEDLFNNYYAAINYQVYNKIKKVKRATRLSPHNLFYLLLKEIFNDDEKIKRILGLSQEGLRSIRNRTKPI